MTKEEKELVLKDLCSRLPYKPKVHIEHDVFYDEREPYDTELSLSVLYNRCGGMEIKPYLRPIPSMTDEERKEFDKLINLVEERCINGYGKGGYSLAFTELNDWLNAHLFDYRCLIDKGLALEAPEGMYTF